MQAESYRNHRYTSPTNLHRKESAHGLATQHLHVHREAAQDNANAAFGVLPELCIETAVMTLGNATTYPREYTNTMASA
jgi:hypothetical protein